MKFKITFILILGCVTAFAQKQVTFFEPDRVSINQDGTKTKEYTDFNLYYNGFTNSSYFLKLDNKSSIYHLNDKKEFQKIYSEKIKDSSEVKMVTANYNNLSVFRNYLPISNYVGNKYNQNQTFLNPYLIDEISKNVGLITPNSLLSNYIHSDVQFVENIEDFKVPLKINFPEKVKNQCPYCNNQNYIFSNDTTGLGGNALYSYSKNTGLKKLFSEEVRIFNLFSQFLIVSKKGEVYLLNNLDRPEIFSMGSFPELWAEKLNSSILETGVLLYSDKKMWFFDGNCKNSKLIYEAKGEEKIENFIYKLNDNKFLFKNQSGFNFYNGKQGVSLKNPQLQFIGIQSNKFYMYKTEEWLVDGKPTTKYFLIEVDVEIGSQTVLYEEYFKPGGILGFEKINKSNKKYLFFGSKSWIINEKNEFRELAIIGDYKPLFENNNNIYIKKGYLGGTIFRVLPNNNIEQVGVTNGYQMISDKFIYLFEEDKIINRISLSDYSKKKIKLPNSIYNYILISGKNEHPYTSYSIINNKPHAKINTPETGLQLWELDDAEQNFQTAPEPTYFYKGNPECRQTAEPRLVSQTSPYLEILATEVPKDKMSMYPNPVNNNINVVLPAEFDAQKTKVQILNASGSIVSTDLILNANVDKNNSFNISVPHLSSGVYQLIFVDNKQKKYNLKFIKQ